MFTEIIHAKHDELGFYQALYPEMNIFFSWTRCHWCQKIQPLIGEALRRGVQYPVLQLIADDHDNLQRLATLKGYPTIRRYSNGTSRDFNQNRTVDNLHEFFNSK